MTNAITYLLLVVILYLLINIVDKSNTIANRMVDKMGCGGYYQLGSYDYGSHSYADSAERRP
jgi:hypothetical protein